MLKKTLYLEAYEEVIECPNILETTVWSQNSEKEKVLFFLSMPKESMK